MTAVRMHHGSSGRPAPPGRERRRTWAAAFSVLLAALVAACEDTGGLSVVPVSLAPVHVTETNVSTGTLRESAIRVRFDRPLLPITALRQSLYVVTNTNSAVESPVVTYDPIRREISLKSPLPPGKEWLAVGGYYRLVLGIPSGDALSGGVRAIDGAVLGPAETRVFGFVVAAPEPVAEPKTTYCNDVHPWLVMRCASCHEGPSAAMGLDLSSPSAMKRTAVEVLAKETANGPEGSSREPSSHVLAQDLVRIAPHDPSRSYLLYKAFLGEGARTGAPVGCPGSPFADRGAPLSDEDRSALADRIPGQAMPFTGDGASRDELLHLQRWIADGAELPASCTECK